MVSAEGATVTEAPLAIGPIPWSMLPVPLLNVAASLAVWPSAMLAGLAMKLWIAAADATGATSGLPQAATARSRAGSAMCRDMGDLRLPSADACHPPVSSIEPVQ